MGGDTLEGPSTADTCMFSPVKLGELMLRNRLAVAPMTRVSATADGLATQQMAAYYAAFAAGGFGLVVTEGVYTDRAYSQGYLFQPGLTNAAQRDAWRRVVEGVHREGAHVVAQLMHAGALSQGNPYRADSIAPSVVQPRGHQMSFYRGGGPYPLPKAMSTAEIEEVVDGFATAAGLAKAAGFDGVEIHGANGYLLDQFLTEYTNQRMDRYGGETARRLRLISDVIQAVRAAVGREFLVGLRISQGKVNDFTHKWAGREVDAESIFGGLAGQPIDYVHPTEFEAWQPAFAERGPSLAALAMKYTSAKVVANGSLHDPLRVAQLLRGGDADLVSLGRGALMHPDWPERARAAAPIEDFDARLIDPIADLANAQRVRESTVARGPRTLHAGDEDVE